MKAVFSDPLQALLNIIHFLTSHHVNSTPNKYQNPSEKFPPGEISKTAAMPRGWHFRDTPPYMYNTVFKPHFEPWVALNGLQIISF